MIDDVACSIRPLTWSYFQLLQSIGLRLVWKLHLCVWTGVCEVRCEERCTRQWRYLHKPLLPYCQIWYLLHDCSIVSRVTFFPVENKPKKRILIYSFLVQFTCSVTHTLRALRRLIVNITHTIVWLAFIVQLITDSLRNCGATSLVKFLLKMSGTIIQVYQGRQR